ncbi:nucleotidyl transferase AbiEii/AbiGii toxin family protein [Leptolinea tardivitalis]|uniref:Nucleotidyl transferase AbiEii/AbiGii toxin family protein n=2 Tax=Leptolinea tardivitalis TaxID=229920 RepID=A0A0P6WMN8_9CHLR|nr:nucleotidyl transferase AbiEii/AbiGii toxin family protein [Leptolinea tardivitalis]KPL71176.1 hypothetical protein ADM99_13075 [Leptolinea tardivitalis]
MLTQIQAQKFAVENQTVVDNILKEHFQMNLLDLLFNAPFEQNLVFKGGTCLRLAYGSFRFSEDLDFSILADIPFSEFLQVIQKVTTIMPGAEIKDIYNKRNTLYARVICMVEYRPIPIGIKVEVNKNASDFEHTIRMITSPFNNLSVLGRVYSLESILKDKMRIMTNGERRDPRDLFDAWYIHQKVGRDFDIPEEFKYSRKELMDSLFHFIPQNQRKVIELFVR